MQCIWCAEDEELVMGILKTLTALMVKVLVSVERWQASWNLTDILQIYQVWLLCSIWAHSYCFVNNILWFKRALNAWGAWLEWKLDMSYNIKNNTKSVYFEWCCLPAGMPIVANEPWSKATEWEIPDSLSSPRYLVAVLNFKAKSRDPNQDLTWKSLKWIPEEPSQAEALS